MLLGQRVVAPISRTILADAGHCRQFFAVFCCISLDARKFQSLGSADYFVFFATVLHLCATLPLSVYH